MNKEFHDYAVERINSMSTEELGQGLRDAGILSNNQNQAAQAATHDASIEAEREMMQTIRHRLDQGLDNYPLNYKQSLFLQDLLLRLEQAARRTQATTGELPPLPGRVYHWNNLDLYERSDVQNYARAAIEADRAQQAVPDRVLQARDAYIADLEQRLADLRAQLAQQGQEPVATVVEGRQIRFLANGKDFPKAGTLLYAAPASAQLAQQAGDALAKEAKELIAQYRKGYRHGYEEGKAEIADATPQPAARVVVPDGQAVETMEFPYVEGWSLPRDLPTAHAVIQKLRIAYARAMLAASSATVTAPAQLPLIEAVRSDIIDFLRASNDTDCANRVEEFMTAEQIAKNIATVTEPSAPADDEHSVIAKLPEIHTALIQAYRAGALRSDGNGIDAGAYAEAERIMRAWNLPDAAPAAQQAAPTECAYPNCTCASTYECEGGAAPATTGMVGQDAKDAALAEIFAAIDEAQRMNRYNESSFQIGTRVARLKCLADEYRTTLAAQQAQASAKGESNG